MALLLVVGCASGLNKGGKLPSPFDLKADTVSHGATIYWSVNRGKSKAVYGYNIYLSEKPLENSFKHWQDDHPAPFNHTPYPGDTDGDKNHESFEITGLENGRTYYVSVRTLGSGGVESPPSNEISFKPMARGTFVISSNHLAENGGFSFETESSTVARDPRCDIYLYAKGDEIGLSSPSKLGAGLRKTYFSRPGIVTLREMDSIKISRGERIDTSSKYGRAELTIKKINQGKSVTEAVIEYVFYPADGNRQ